MNLHQLQGHSGENARFETPLKMQLEKPVESGASDSNAWAVNSCLTLNPGHDPTC